MGPAQIDAALARLSVLPDLPVVDHVDVFETVYGALADALDTTAD